MQQDFLSQINCHHDNLQNSSLPNAFIGNPASLQHIKSLDLRQMHLPMTEMKLIFSYHI